MKKRVLADEERKVLIELKRIRREYAGKAKGNGGVAIVGSVFGSDV